MKKKSVIGLTGKNAAGKGEVAKYLMSKGFAYYSLSDVIRREMAKKGIELTRDNMIEFGNNLRKRYGPGILGRKIKKMLKKKSIVDSIRNISEIRELRKLPHFFLIGVDAPVELRFRRLLKRGRLGDAKTPGDFIMKERKEDVSASTGLQLSKCLKETDVIIQNKGLLKNLYKKIDVAMRS